MSTFLYWIPIDRPTNTTGLLELLRSNGLAYAVEDRIVSRTADAGPDGRRGATVCRAGEEQNLGYWPDSQTWKRIAGTDIWCGMFSDRRPTPDNLAREEQVQGELLALDDGHRWMAPKARRWVESDGTLAWTYNLPQRLTLDDDGLWVPGGLKPRYQKIWDMSVAYMQAGQDDDGKYRFSLDDLNALAVASLQINYRVGATELDLLGVFDETSRQRIINVLIDMDTLLEWGSKKNEEGLSGGSS